MGGMSNVLPEHAGHRARLPAVVVTLGLVSFFNDLASEMVTPLIPVLLAAVLGAGPVALGLVEGVAETVAAWLKLYAGRRSDLWGARRKPFVLAGYFLSNCVRPLMALAGSWGMVVALRGLDRVGKGLRTAPRDALVADATPASLRGRAYGLHRALDNGGAMGGALLAAACLAWTPLSLQQMILLSALPGFVGVALVAFVVRDHGAQTPPAPGPLPPLHWRGMAPGLRRYFVLLGLFSFARASESFVVLRGYELQMLLPSLLLLWAAMNFVKALAAWVGGRLSDAWGRLRIVQLYWVLHGLSFLFFAQVESMPALWAAAIAYGACAGFGEGAERALVADLGHAAAPGTAFGWYNMTLGLAALPAGLCFGGVWQAWGAGTAFGAAALLALTAASCLRFAMPRSR